MIFEAKAQPIKAGTETPAPWVLIGSEVYNSLAKPEGREK